MSYVFLNRRFMLIVEHEKWQTSFLGNDRLIYQSRVRSLLGRPSRAREGDENLGQKYAYTATATNTGSRSVAAAWKGTRPFGHSLGWLVW